jgi:adenylyltransferase/sulfurtransferase
MNDEQLLRYSRQILLPEFGSEGQEKLLNSRVLLIGVGGLGSPVAMYLAAAGVGELVLVDFDQVDLSNLQRQIAHRTSSIGQSKVSSASQTLDDINPQCRVTTIEHKLSPEQLEDEIRRAHVVVDASDNFATRYQINAQCVALQTPLVSGAAIRMEGQVAVFLNLPDSPCYKCLYRDGEDEEQTCSENGVMAPMVGIIGSIQAMETIKVLAGIGTTLDGRLLIVDGLHMETRIMKLKPDPQCPVCGSH